MRQPDAESDHGILCSLDMPRNISQLECRVTNTPHGWSLLPKAMWVAWGLHRIGCMPSHQNRCYSRSHMCLWQQLRSFRHQWAVHGPMCRGHQQKRGQKKQLRQHGIVQARHGCWRFHPVFGRIQTGWVEQDGFRHPGSSYWTCFSACRFRPLLDSFHR